MNSNIPSARTLCVDLDGTLIATDMLWESAFSVLKVRPWLLLMLPVWLSRGRAHLKHRLAEAAHIDFSTLPYRQHVLDLLETEKGRGRAVVLATASDRLIAEGISRHLGLFTKVLASDGTTNLKSRAKEALLVEEFGMGNFDYIGDGRADIPCWKSAVVAMTVDPSWANRLPNLQSLEDAHKPPVSTLKSLIRAIRPHQWAKNLLLFVPALAAHRFEWSVQWDLILAFCSLSLCASGGYILNDLLDVTADRQHPRKRFRPFAAGDLSLSTGILLVLVAWVIGLGLAAIYLPTSFVLAVLLYLVATGTYSLRLKREAVLDVMFLAGLYVMRVIAGGAATGIPVSTWMLAFTLFVCLSLAFLKRFIEVRSRPVSSTTNVPGRGYIADDAAWLHSAGTTCAYLSAVVLAIYVNNADVTRLYGNPDRLLLICPILLYWATRIWFKAHRGAMHDDPLVAVAADPMTYILAAMSAVIVWVAV